MNGIDNLLVPNTIVSIRAVFTVYKKVRPSPCFVVPWVPEATRLLNPAGQRPAKRA